MPQRKAALAGIGSFALGLAMAGIALWSLLALRAWPAGILGLLMFWTLLGGSAIPFSESFPAVLSWLVDGLRMKIPIKPYDLGA